MPPDALSNRETPIIVNDLINEVFTQEMYDKYGVPKRLQELARRTLTLQHLQGFEPSGRMAEGLHLRMFKGEDQAHAKNSFAANGEIYKKILESGEDCDLVLYKPRGLFLK